MLIGVCVGSSFLYIVCFFFKHKTAYEMRISDWSSDVCSSDLTVERTEFEADESRTSGGKRMNSLRIYTFCRCGRAVKRGARSLPLRKSRKPPVDRKSVV